MLAMAEVRSQGRVEWESLCPPGRLALDGDIMKTCEVSIVSVV